MNGVNFYRSRGKFLARGHNPVSRKRIATERRFARTRENYAEFSTASRAGKLLRHALNMQLLNARDGRVANRLMGLMLKITKTDPLSKRGKRNPANGDLDLLRNFEFNNQTTLERSFKPRVEAHINRETGMASVATTAFIPEQHTNYPAGATHYQLLFAGVELDFINGTSVTAAAETKLLEIDNNRVEPVNLNCRLTPNSKLPQAWVLGIVFTQMVNGKEYPLNDKSFNALQVVKVNDPKNSAVVPGKTVQQSEPLNNQANKHIADNQKPVKAGNSGLVTTGLPIILNQGPVSGEGLCSGIQETIAPWLAATDLAAGEPQPP